MDLVTLTGLTPRTLADALSRMTPGIPKALLSEAAQEGLYAGLSPDAVAWWWRVVNQSVTGLRQTPLRCRKLTDPDTGKSVNCPQWDRLPVAVTSEAVPVAVTTWAGWPPQSGRGRSVRDAFKLGLKDAPQWENVAQVLPWLDLCPPQAANQAGFLKGLATLRDAVTMEEAVRLRALFPATSPTKLAEWVTAVRRVGGAVEHLETWARADDFIGPRVSSIGTDTYFPQWQEIRQRYADAEAAGVDPAYAPAAAAAGHSVEEAAQAVQAGFSIDSFEVLAALR